MSKNYLRLLFRQLGQRPMFSFILISGLTIGLAAALLVSTIVINDLSYDRQWSKSDRIYRIFSSDKLTGEKAAITEVGLPPELKRNLPEVEDYCRMNTEEIRLRVGGLEQGVAVKCLGAEASVFNFLDLRVLEGNPQNPVAGVSNLVITESFRDRYFKGINPVGKRMTSISTYNSGDTFVITGVVKDLPRNTHLRADVLEIRLFQAANNQLNGTGSYTLLPAYVLLRPGADVKAVTVKANNWYRSVTKDKVRTETGFQPISDVYLRTDFQAYQDVKGSIRTVYILSGTAILLLLIACINYVNLSTAIAIKRARATGIRKILGASRLVLLRQFVGESLTYFFISFSLAALLFISALPLLETFSGNPLPLGITRQWSLFIMSGAVVFLIAILTSFYPAFVLSRPDMVTAFSHSASAGRNTENFRRGLVVLQFAISIVLLIATTVVHRQVKLLEESPLGYDRQDLVVMDWNQWGESSGAFRNAVNGIGGVRAASVGRWVPGGGGGSMTSRVDDPDHPGSQLVVQTISADPGFPKTLGLHLLRGRWLDPSYGYDAPNFDSLMTHMDVLGKIQVNQSELVTESMAKKFHITTLGVKVKGLSGTPVGIIADFKNESLKTAQGYCVIQAESKGTYGGILIRTAPGAAAHVKTAIARLFHEYYPSKVLKMNDASILLEKQYEAETRLMQIFFFFSGLVVFLSCMGLFGLVTFMVQSHVKEIGIRKVLGASTERITVMFTWSFLRLVLVSALLAIPVGGWLMHRWLQDYPYRTPLNWWLFVVPLAAAVVVATLTVGVQSVRAAMANPADALRTE